MATPAPHGLKIVALGSSFASGASIPPITNVTANRSSSNYASQLAQRLDNATLLDLSASGCTLLNILSEPQTFMTGETFPPQLSLLPADADIVTLTAGGNDIGYSKGMVVDSLPPASGNDDDDELREMLEAMGMMDFSNLATPTQIRERFISIIDAIHSRAPKAKVYLVEYLSVFGSASLSSPTAKTKTPLTSSQQQKYISQAKELAQAYQEVAKAREGTVQVECVPMAALSEGHCLGSEEPWIEGFVGEVNAFFRGPSAYHPNRAGHEAAAEELYRRIVQGSA